MNKGEFEIRILDDGRAKIVSGSFAGAEHIRAENMVAFLEGLLGGEVETTKADHSHSHSHNHGHSHDRDHHHH